MDNRVVIDTNIMVSFLIGKRLSKLKDSLSNSSFKLILTHQLISELKLVTSRPKFKNYFNKQDVNELIELFSIIGLMYQIQDIPNVCRDSKDNFLLSLCYVGKAKYLVTGDKDLLDLCEYKGTRIISAGEFEKLL
jgi:putative PIN family toxin of toxin-antitoxin system